MNRLRKSSHQYPPGPFNRKSSKNRRSSIRSNGRVFEKLVGPKIQQTIGLMQVLYTYIQITHVSKCKFPNNLAPAHVTDGETDT